MPRRDLRRNALDALMGGAPAEPSGHREADPTGGEAAAEEPTREPLPQKPPTRPTPRRGGKAEKAPKTRADGAAPDGYVGRSRYKRKKRGIVAKVAVHLSPDVADALRRAGAVGDENGTNMSEIVEALLRRAGYGGGGGE